MVSRETKEARYRCERCYYYEIAGINKVEWCSFHKVNIFNTSLKECSEYVERTEREILSKGW